MFDRIRERLFASEKEEQVSPNQSSTAYAGSVIYGTHQFEKYNPDMLIAQKGHKIYQKMMLDEQVKAVVKFKRDAITGRDYYFELDSETLGDEEIERRIALFNAILEKMEGSFVDTLNKVMSAAWQGYSITEKVFQPIEFDKLTYWGIKHLRKKPFETFTFTEDEYGNVTKFMQRIGMKELELDLENFIHMVVNPDLDEHYGPSELREAYRAWWSKDNIVKFWNIWLERHAGGFIALEPEKGITITKGTQIYNDLLDSMNNFQVKSWIMLPQGVKANVQYPSNQVAYKDAIAFHNQAIAKALLVPNLLGVTEQYGYGSYAQSNTQLEAFFWTLDADAIRLEETLNEQLFRELGLINFNDEEYPKFRFKPVSNQMKIEIAKTWKEMVTGGAVEATDTDEQHIRDLLDIPDKGEPLKKNSPPSDGNAGLLPQQDEDIPNPPPASEGGDPKDKKVEDPAKVEETILGKKSMITVAMVRAAVNRVRFDRIDAVSNKMIDDSVEGTSQIFMGIAADAVKGMGAKDGLKTQNISIGKEHVTQMKRNFKKMLQESWKLGQAESGEELNLATKNAKFAATSLPNSAAASYFESKAFEMTGSFTDEARRIITGIMQQGVKYGKTVKQMEKEVYETFATKGLITIEDAKQALGEALSDGTRTITEETAAHRLRTVIKTQTFEAINEARFNRFTDPDVEGFVEALQYSAILDSRTTKKICQKLDDKVFAADSDLWNKYRPPNHYNCRSILVPITAGEEWEEDDDPDLALPDGFA